MLDSSGDRSHAQNPAERHYLLKGLPKLPQRTTQSYIVRG